jgi:hypothetical protein
METYNKLNLMKIAKTISKGRDDFGDISIYVRIVLRLISVK